jgi:hypothetical protein
VALILIAWPVTVLGAQGFNITPMGQLIFTVDHSDPVPGGGSLTEARVVQPVLMLDGSAFGGKLAFVATADFEGLTIPHGELTPGAWGEGFVDRRHPHTYAHELTVAGNDLLGRLDGSGRLGVVVGKGFVPFGTDDPMSRPFVRYPVNHHLAQILERAIGVVQYGLGPVTIEAALFNGDEPTRPGDWPVIRTPQGTWRFGDSRAARVTVRPVQHFEVQGSLARVSSPENRDGGGPEVYKASTSARWDDHPSWGERYVLIEWERSDELGNFLLLHSLLAEAMVRRGRFALSYRFERTDRPEEPRLVDPFRTVYPNPDNDIAGITRWTLHTLHLSADLFPHGTHLGLQPYIEVTRGSVASVAGGVFDPFTEYGTDDVNALNVGLKVDWGMAGHRMGRYGVLDEPMMMMPPGAMRM